MTMAPNKTSPEIPASKKTQKRPTRNIGKIGIVARDYNESGDFSDSLPAVLQLLDKKGCDAVLFSLFSLKTGYDPREALKGLKKIKAVFVETFVDKPKRERRDFFVYYRTSSGWKKYQLEQKFGTIKRHKTVHAFVKDEMPNRCLGNCCVLLCGESNGVNYKTDDKKIHDDFKLRKAIPEKVRIILNPCHDRMTRFQIPMKREFLSKNGRWVISVWCKGKKKNDGERPAWMIYHNGKERIVDETIDDFESSFVYVGILNVR